MTKFHPRKAGDATNSSSSMNTTPTPRQNAQQQPAPGQRTTAMGSAPAANGEAANTQTAGPVGRAEGRNGAAATGAMELKVEAGESSTVTVTADGKTVFSGKLEALKTLTLHAEDSFTVSASKSNAILLELNGRTVPPLGPPNEPGKITLTRDNLKSNPGEEY